MKNFIAAVAVVGLAAACSSTTVTPAEGSVSVASDVASIKNDGTKANLTATATQANGKPATGSISFTAAYGDVNGTGTGTATATLDANGTAKVTYACNVATDAHCVAGTVLISASITGNVSGAASLGITGPGGTTGGTTGGGTDGGTIGGTDAGVVGTPTITVATVFPAVIVTQDVANPSAGLPGTTTVTFIVKTASGAAVPGATVNFSESLGESLVTLGATTGTTDAGGLVNVTATSKLASGTAHVVAVLGSGQDSATASVPILGAPSIITWQTSNPAVLGLKGSGIQENGLMTFLVTDSLGTPVPQAAVDFTQLAPSLVTLNTASASTDETGHVTVTFSSGSEVGVTQIQAKVRTTGAVATHSVAVRGAKPSAAGFYFRCEHASLPVYTTVAQHETMTCTVRLADRFGNRVGVPTVVAFATEAGMITANTVTKGFDPATPNDPDEGSASVTFSSDIGNGSAPADVDPLPALTGQYPWDRAAEPSFTSGSLKLNPRDQLVTIIAMTRGEEAFQDANHNGILDANEVFVDQGDPFIDVNDNGAYDQGGPGSGGLFETRFCGLSDCSTYHGPNGVWDSDTIIWQPTWVVFTGIATATAVPIGGPAPTTQFQLPCADYANSFGAGHASLITAPVYVYDDWLNIPSAGTSVKLGTPSVSALNATSYGLGTYAESWGTMGVLGFDFDYRPVASAGANAGKACTIANGQACVNKLLFRDFSTGFAGTAAIQNGKNAPDAQAPLGASTTGFGCAPNIDQYGSGSFLLGVDVVNAHDNTVTSTYGGLYAHGN